MNYIRNKSFITTLIVGIMMMISPWMATGLAALLIGGFIAAGGIAAIVVNVRAGTGLRGGMIYGIVRTLIGLYIITHTSAFLSIFPVLMGIYLIADGVSGLSDGFGRNRIVSIITMVIGAILLFNPLGSLHSAVWWCGALLTGYSVVGMIGMGNWM